MNNELNKAKKLNLSNISNIIIIITIITLISLLLIPANTVSAEALQMPGFEGGIANERDYKEVIFITGEPIVMEGTVSIRGSEERPRYTYDLQNREHEASMRRNLTLEREFRYEEDKNQVITTMRVTNARETISVGNTRYTLGTEDYQFSQSVVRDENPVVNYYSGSWDGRKTYEARGEDGRITVDIVGDMVGYDHHWGGTETHKINYFIDYDVDHEIDGEMENVQWTASPELTVSFNTTKDLEYVENDPAWISFRGGFLQTEVSEGILNYEYNLPRFDDDGYPSSTRRVRGSGYESLNTIPTNQRLPIPQLRDISGHWAERDIEVLTSLGIIETDGSYIAPNQAMTRGEFARAIAITTDMEFEEEDEDDAVFIPPWMENDNDNDNNDEDGNGLYEDVPTDHELYEYVQAVSERGLMTGLGTGYFGLDQPLTRAQALTIIVRAIGLENLAPNPPFNTHFVDDSDIPSWSKPAVYVGYQLGMVQGDSYGRMNPNANMTRAEASAFINRFISFLQHDIRTEYIDRIFSY